MNPAVAAGCIGPNAITRMAEALAGEAIPGLAARVFGAAGLGFYLEAPPGSMVSDDEVARLYAALFADLGEMAARRVAREAGRRTGDYLLANRIPKAAQAALHRLPRRWAARLLLAAIGKHSWTFAGSGAFAWSFRPRLELVIFNSPLCRYIATHDPACGFYAATFERIFRAIVDPRTEVIETQCIAAGAPDCRFAVIWP